MIYLLLPFFLVCAFLTAEEKQNEEAKDPAEQVVVAIEKWLPGKDWVKQVEEKYHEGDYQRFLQNISSLYEKGGASSSMKQILKEEQELLEVKDQEGIPLKERIHSFYQGLEIKREKTLQDLALICRQAPEVEVCQFVKSLLNGKKVDKEGREAFEYFENLALSQQAPTSDEEKKIKKICEEYHVKKLFLQADIEFKEYSREEQNAFLFVLICQQLEIMEGMLQKTGQTALREKVEAAKKALIIGGERAHNWEFLIYILNTPIVEAHSIYDDIKRRLMGFRRAQRKLILSNRLSVGKFDPIFYPLFYP